jgi:beta-mannosidase
VRVWGGGIHETEDFYGLCDELGLLVWQDALFACAAYAEEEPLAGEVRAEVAEAVTRLSAHPSLVLWCGGNECLWGHEDWGWKEQLAGRTWGSGYWLRDLPALVRELDPTRPYIPGSPYSPGPGRHPNDPSHGPMHIWDVWNQRDWTAYRSYTPRFVSEFGFQGPPTWATLTRAIHDEPLAPDSPGMLAHQKAEDGNGKLARGLRGHLPEPATFDDWHWATQLNQARALTAGIEHFRALAPVCTGAVVWQLNDCWPVSSWAVVDGDGRLKPAWYAVRRAFRDRLAVVRRPLEGGDGLELALLADGAEPWDGTARVERLAFDGTVLATAELPFALAARDSTALRLPGDVAEPADPARELLVVRPEGAAAAWFWFAEDVDGALPAPSCEVAAVRAGDGYDVTVTAGTLLKDVALLADRLDPDAVVDDMLLTLLPGESATLHVRTTRSLDAAQLAAPPVLRCANDLIAS